MSKFIASGLQSLVRRIVSYSSRQVQSMMAASGFGSENDTQDDPETEDAIDPRRISDDDEAETHSVLADGNSTTASPSKADSSGDILDGSSSVQKWQSFDGSSPRVSLLGQEKHYSLGENFFIRDQPRRPFHHSIWSNLDEGSRTREQAKEEKGRQTSVEFRFYLTFC